MNIKYFITTLLIATTLVACSDIDEVDNSNLRNEVKIFASVTERDGDDPQSRANLDGTGAGTIGNGKQIRLNYTNGTSSGSMIYTFGETTLYWDDLVAEIGSPPFNFTAFYPAISNEVLTSGFNVAAAEDPDLLSAHVSGVNDGQNVNLVFNHIMHKLVVNLTSSQGVYDDTQLSNAVITLRNVRSTTAPINVNGAVNNEIVYGEYDAYPVKRGANNFLIVAPQPLTASSPLLSIEINERTFLYRPATDLTHLLSGKMLTLNLDLNREQVIHVSNVMLSINSLALNIGDTENRLSATVFPVIATDQRVKWHSTNPTVATTTVIANRLTITALALGTADIVVTTEDGDYTDICTVVVTALQDAVTINGVVWATRNVDMPGIFAARPESSGMFYQWGKNVGWSATDPLVNSNGGSVWDNIQSSNTIWENDPCPAGWRVPTQAEFQSLISSSIAEANRNGVHGDLYGTAPNQIFLPIFGYRGMNSNLTQHTDGAYWGNAVNGNPHPVFGRAAVSLHSPNRIIFSGEFAGYRVRCVAE
ncbi:MAG: fimbrillin family protein [Dysgonamonadaceae bacterium]|jgi:hypothetical protein|nr:fimbrillin family protein [Dysgonamonadaceae bacterium]